MYVIPFAVQIVMFAAMVGVSLWGWRSIDADFRFPIRFGGASGFQSTMSKHSALVLWPALGAIVVAGSGAVSSEEGGRAATVGWLGAVAVGILLAGQVAAVRRAPKS